MKASNESRILETPDCASWMGLGYTERDHMELLDILNKNAKIIVLEVRPRYWKDATINLVVDGLGTRMPCISNGKWCPSIDIETGKITNWVQGKTASVHYKVCDDGTYHIFGKKGEFLYRQDSYVPEFLSIGENGYGDYIIMEIDENGYIQYWDKKIDFESFVNSAI